MTSNLSPAQIIENLKALGFSVDIHGIVSKVSISDKNMNYVEFAAVKEFSTKLIDPDYSLGQVYDLIEKQENLLRIYREMEVLFHRTTNLQDAYITSLQKQIEVLNATIAQGKLS